MKEIKDFIEMIEQERKEAFRCSNDMQYAGFTRNEYEHRWDALNDVIESKEYQALKSSISPVSEDKVSISPVGEVLLEQIKDAKKRSQFYNQHFTDLVQMMVDNPKPEVIDKSEQPTDIQSNDGWIEHDGKYQPIDDFTEVEVEFVDGEKILDVAGNFDACWLWQARFPPEDTIIAYRIIDEPKALCMCAEYEGSNFKCPLCEPEKEPKKQTLLEHMLNNPMQLTHREKALWSLASEYWEQNK
jgi:hypothetical protein